MRDAEKTLKCVGLSVIDGCALVSTYQQSAMHKTKMYQEKQSEKDYISGLTHLTATYLSKYLKRFSDQWPGYEKNAALNPRCSIKTKSNRVCPTTT